MSQAEELLMDRIEENEKRICKEKKKRLLKSLEEAMEKAKSIDHVKENLKDRTCPNCENVISQHEFESPVCVYVCDYCEKRICSSCQSDDCESSDICKECWERICEEKVDG